MDPNATLAEIRGLVRAMFDNAGLPDDNEVIRLAELVEALDGWLSKGGFLPQAWRKA